MHIERCERTGFLLFVVETSVLASEMQVPSLQGKLFAGCRYVFNGKKIFQMTGYSQLENFFDREFLQREGTSLPFSPADMALTSLTC